MNTFSCLILKPGVVERFGEVAQVLKANNVKIVEAGLDVMTQKEAEVHYDEHKEKDFFKTLVGYMTTGDVKGICQFNPESVRMVVTSLDENETEEEFISRTRKLVKEKIRPMLAFTREEFPDLSEEDFKELTMTANGIHASDSGKAAIREINNLFPGHFHLQLPQERV